MEVCPFVGMIMNTFSRSNSSVLMWMSKDEIAG